MSEITRTVLSLFDQADCHSDLFWRVEPERIRWFAMCSDEFWWATADSEEITEDDLPRLKQTFDDLAALDETLWLAELYAARKRGMRPQRASLKLYTKGATDDRLVNLFLACGPERDPKSEG